jgi:polyhydroxybutyrate depolymerase
MIHGEQDPNVKYYGGQGAGDGNLYAKPVAEAVAFWTAADGCTGTPVTETSTDGNVITEDHTVCSAGSEVELVTIVNGLHEWPTLEGHTGFSATDAIWEFFARHSK